MVTIECDSATGLNKPPLVERHCCLSENAPQVQLASLPVVPTLSALVQSAAERDNRLGVVCGSLMPVSSPVGGGAGENAKAVPLAPFSCVHFKKV